MRPNAGVASPRSCERFLASSEQFPGVFGEGETPEEATESFWEMVDFIGELASRPDWPHPRDDFERAMHERGDDALPADDDGWLSSWDDEEWEQA